MSKAVKRAEVFMEKSTIPVEVPLTKTKLGIRIADKRNNKIVFSSRLRVYPRSEGKRAGARDKNMRIPNLP
ncbi:MAG: hypothetical protein WA705_12595 [Candidatus Ozemobacteraceae bacterium]